MRSEDTSRESKSSRNLRFFTTDSEIGQVLIKQAAKKVKKEIIEAMFQRSEDMPMFLGGTHSKNGKNKLRMYQFDLCISEFQHDWE